MRRRPATSTWSRSGTAQDWMDPHAAHLVIDERSLSTPLVRRLERVSANSMCRERGPWASSRLGAITRSRRPFGPLATELSRLLLRLTLGPVLLAR